MPNRATPRTCPVDGKPVRYLRGKVQKTYCSPACQTLAESRRQAASRRAAKG